MKASNGARVDSSSGYSPVRSPVDRRRSARWRKRSTGLVLLATGVLLGSLAPLGSFLLRIGIRGVGMRDLADNQFFYLYELIGSAAVFGIFGFALGIRMDRLRGRRDWYREKADHDDLTGFLSHTAFRREVSAAADIRREARESLAILILAAGPVPGSESGRGSHSTKTVLLHVAAAARHVCKTESVIGRWGGLELAVLLPSADAFAAEELARDLRARVLDRPVFDSGNRTFWQVTVGGVAGVPALSGDRLLARAQDALGEAHRSKEGIVILST